MALPMDLGRAPRKETVSMSDHEDQRREAVERLQPGIHGWAETSMYAAYQLYDAGFAAAHCEGGGEQDTIKSTAAGDGDQPVACSTPALNDRCFCGHSRAAHLEHGGDLAHGGECRVMVSNRLMCTCHRFVFQPSSQP